MITAHKQTQPNTYTQFTKEQQKRIVTLLKASKAKNTIKAYKSDWTQFMNFCESNNLTYLPANPETIMLYISELSKTHKFSTIKRHLTSINKAHISANHPSPTNIQNVKALLDGISRTNGNKQEPKKALILDDMKRLIDCIDTSTLAGLRDKALLLVGFATASRRSELVSINVQDIAFTSQGVDIKIYQTKTKEDITKSIVAVGNEYCPVGILRQWVEISQINNNAVFRSISKSQKIGERLSDKTVANLIKKYAEMAGLDPDLYAGHSLRSGFITSAAHEGYNDAAIMKQSGHSTRAMIDRYTQEGRRYENNATTIMGKM